jgi:hypothetical protein
MSRRIGLDQEDGQDTAGSDDVAYGCCGQALTRFTSHPPSGPDRPPRSRTEAIMVADLKRVVHLTLWPMHRMNTRTI